MVVLLFLAHCLLAALFVYLANWIGMIPWRKAAQAHWTERARLLWPVRFTAAINIFLLTVSLDLLHRFFFPATAGWWIPNGMAAFLGALLGCYPFEREIFPQLDFRNWRHQVAVGWGIQFGIWAALIAACLLMPEQPGGRMLLVAGGYLAFHLALQWGWILRYLRWVKFLTPAEPRLQQIVEPMAARLNVQVRATWQLRGILALAFAFPTTRELAISNRALEICSDEEIASVCAHELAHLTESRAALAGRLLGSLVLFPLIFMIPAVHHFQLPGMLLPYLGMFGIAAFARRLTQRMEQRADQLALAGQTNEGVYARALEKIYRENQIPAVNVSNRQTHPHLYDRMLAAGLTPDFPRPAKPARLTLVGWVYAFAFGIFLGRLFTRW